MRCVSVYLFELIFMALLLKFHACHAQLTTESASPTITATWTGTYTDFAVCATGGGDWLMDPPTAVRLGDLFCEALSKPENYPAQGSTHLFLPRMKFPVAFGCLKLTLLTPDRGKS